MNLKILPLLALLAFAAAPIVIGSAETASDAKKDTAATAKDAATKDGTSKDAAAAAEEKPARKLSSECIASEEVIADLEAREHKLKQREEALKEREKDLADQAASVKEDLAKLDQKKSDQASAHQKELEAHDEQVNKLIETFEGMSPKAAAAVIAGIDDELAVTALGKLTSVKAGKILANLKPEKSSHLSEMMAYGKVKGKETAHGENDDHARTPASNR